MTQREKLIELLVETVREPGLFPTCEDIADYLINNGVTVQEWISVGERLPELDVPVLATDGKDIGRGRLLKHRLWIAPFCDGVTHWMPMPEPPKEEK